MVIALYAFEDRERIPFLGPCEASIFCLVGIQRSELRGVHLQQDNSVTRLVLGVNGHREPTSRLVEPKFMDVSKVQHGVAGQITQEEIRALPSFVT